MIQTHQLQILAVLGQIPVRGDIQLSAICKLDLVHALLDSSDAMPRLLHRSAEESDQSSQARLHVGERFVVIQAEVIQISISYTLFSIARTRCPDSSIAALRNRINRARLDSTSENGL